VPYRRKKLTFAILSPDEFLLRYRCKLTDKQTYIQTRWSQYFVSIPRAIFVLSGPLKSKGNLCCGVRSKRIILNNGMRVRLLQPTVMLQTAWSVLHYIVTRERSHPLRWNLQCFTCWN